MKLSGAQIEVLIGLHVMQPVTVKGLQAYLGRSCENNSDALLQLCSMKLVERVKWTPPPLTYAEHAGFDHMPLARMGKRPYLYQLTPAAQLCAFYLFHAFEKLPETIE